MYPETIVVFFPVFLLVLLSMLGWMLFWKSWDKKNTEPLVLLILTAVWSMVFTYFLKGFVDNCNPLNPGSVFLAIIFLEEFIKAFALVNALESLGKYFEEKNDGIIYGAAAGLGFVFVETIFYLQVTDNFWQVYLGRMIYTFPAHMVFTAIFGMYYARAYVGKIIVGKGQKRKQAPFAILANVFEAAKKRIPEKEREEKRIYLETGLEILRILTLHITRKHIIMGKPSDKHWASELFLEGFVLAFYLHVGYNYLISSSLVWMKVAGLVGIILVFAGLLLRFLQLEKEEK